MASLYEITGELRSLLDAADDGEVDVDLAARLDALEGDLAAKAESIVKAVRNLEAAAEARSNEAARLHLAAARDEARAEQLKAYLKGRLELLGVGKLEAGLFTVAVRRNSTPSVTVDVDPKDLPEEFTRVKVEANKIALGRVWKAGAPLPAGVTVELGSYLSIG